MKCAPWLILVAAVMTSGTASAADWTLDAGVAATRLPDRPGSSRSRIRWLPVISGSHGDRLTFSLDDGVRWTLVDAKPFRFGPVIEYREHDRASHAAGFPGMGNAVEIGAFGEVDTPIAQLEARVRQAVTGYRGLSADISADTGGEIMPGTKVGLEVRAAWAGYRFVQSRFGRDAHGRRPLDPADPDGPNYLSAGVQLSGEQRIARGTNVFVLASVDRLLGSVQSPLIQTRQLRQFSIGITHHFSW